MNHYVVKLDLSMTYFNALKMIRLMENMSDDVQIEHVKELVEQIKQDKCPF